MMKLTLVLFTGVALIGCSSSIPESPANDSGRDAMVMPERPTESADASAADTTPFESRYSEIANCPVAEKDPEGTGFQVTECQGLAQYRLRLTDSDARHDLAVIAPDGQQTELGLLQLFGGAFSTLGPRVEWRSAPSNSGFQPAGLIVRYDVFEHPERPKQPTSYLLAISLNQQPCVIEMLSPGPDQNVQARSAIDRGLDCADGVAATAAAAQS